MNILVTALADLGGEIYSMDIEDSKPYISPNLEEDKLEFKLEDINKTLGLKLEEKDVKKLLEKMGIGLEIIKGKLFALIPAYRTDMLHWIDVAEEIAIAYGYDKFEPEIPKISTIAEEDKKSINKKIISDILIGLGFLECSSFHLTTKEDIKKAYFDFKDFIEIQDSKTEYNVLRIEVLNNLIKIFSENSDSSYPQMIFELGTAFSKGNTETGIKETNKLALAIADEKANFTEIKRVLDYLFKMLDKQYSLEQVENVNYISGRVGRVLIEKQTNGKLIKEDLGFIGEVHPRVLHNFKLKTPISAFEIDLDKLFE